MEVSEAVNAKLKLQKNIYDLIRSFEKETGLGVTGIIIVNDHLGFRKTIVASLELQVSL